MIMTRIKLILIALIAIMLFPTKNNFQPKTVWEHYCKYTLHIHPSQAKTKRIKNLYTKGIHNTYIPNQYNHILYLI